MAQLVWRWSCQRWQTGRWWFESLLVHSGVSSATRRKATGAKKIKKTCKFCGLISGVMHLTWPSITRVYDSDRSKDAVTFKPRYSSRWGFKGAWEGLQGGFKGASSPSHLRAPPTVPNPSHPPCAVPTVPAVPYLSYRIPTVPTVPTVPTLPYPPYQETAPAYQDSVPTVPYP